MAGAAEDRPRGKDGPDPEAEKEKRVLFVGNSYTGGVKGALEKLVRSEKIRTRMQFITPGGRTLLQHADNPKTVETIRSGKWDCVVLQEQSQTPAYFRGRFSKGAERLNGAIRESGAKAVFYMTWGRRDGDKRNASRAPDYETMQKLLTDSYETVGRDLEIQVAPVGRAWREVRERDADLGKQLYRKDGSHPSGKGAYLVALVFARVLFGKQPSEVKFTGGLKKDEVRVMKEAATEVLEEWARSGEGRGTSGRAGEKPSAPGPRK
jgi:hypothetical protein